MRSRLRFALAAFAAGLLVVAVGSETFANPAVTVRVEAVGNLWAAGQVGQPNDGELPAEIPLPQGDTSVWFPRVSGTWSNVGPTFSADGEPPVADPPYACGAPPPCTVIASNGLSGLTDATTFWYLTGAFIGSGLPNGNPPPSIDFTGRHEFTTLKPALGQAFFIGNGRTQDGTVQRFRVPPGATRLFFGMVDICAPGEIAGCFYDNTGYVDVTMSGDNAPDTATLPARVVPRTDSAWFVLAIVGVALVLTAFRLRPWRR